MDTNQRPESWTNHNEDPSELETELRRKMRVQPRSALNPSSTPEASHPSSPASLSERNFLLGFAVAVSSSVAVGWLSRWLSR